MAVTIPAARRKLIERIVLAARQRKAGGKHSDTLVRDYFRGVAEEDLRAYPASELAGAALAHLKSASTRKRKRPLVRVFNADPARDGFNSRHTIVETTL